VRGEEGKGKKRESNKSGAEKKETMVNSTLTQRVRDKGYGRETAMTVAGEFPETRETLTKTQGNVGKKSHQQKVPPPGAT